MRFHDRLAPAQGRELLGMGRLVSVCLAAGCRYDASYIIALTDFIMWRFHEHS
jgi:hypothetical protein